MAEEKYECGFGRREGERQWDDVVQMTRSGVSKKGAVCSRRAIKSDDETGIVHWSNGQFLVNIIHFNRKESDVEMGHLGGKIESDSAR